MTGVLQLVGAMKSDIAIRVLGPVRARATTGWMTAPPQQRLLLALLALQVGHVIPVGDLIDAIWPEAPPASARPSIQVMVTRLRQILAGPSGGVVERCGDGYRLVIAPGSVDVQQFRLLARAARDTPNPVQAIGAFDQALAMWRGPALADVPATARIDAIRFALAEERLSAMHERISALLDIGQNRQATEELIGLMAAHPLAERLAGLLMIALWRCGRQADALQVFRDLRGRLSSELAVEPSQQLQSLHQQILAGDLALPAAAGWLMRSGAQAPRDQHLTIARLGSRPAPRQLPTGAAHFTGRSAELQRLGSLLERPGSATGAVPIAAISGTAGVGKTTLAVHWAHQIAGRFPDGQLYLDLCAFDPTRKPLRIGDAIGRFLDALGVLKSWRPSGLDAQAALYRSVLADRRMLVVLDNAVDEEQVRPLLPGADGCLVLITSRRRLAGLGVCEGAMLLTLDVMSQPEAVTLLAGRLGAKVTAAVPETAGQLATLCGQLPLALSIAAEWADGPDPDLAALTDRMNDLGGRLDVLDAGDERASVRAVFSWSYQNLSRPAARMFCLLGVHPGPDISLAAAASLAGCQVAHASRILAELVSAHLITELVPGRWIVPDLLRAYASELARSEDQPGQDAAMIRVLDYYLHTACSAAVALQPGRDPAFAPRSLGQGAEPDGTDSAAEALAWYKAEHHVLAEVASWAAAAGFTAYAWQLAWALTHYLAITGRVPVQAIATRTALEGAVRAGKAAGQARSTPDPRLRSVSARSRQSQ